MRRENRKGAKGENADFKKVLYISGSVLAVAVIGFVITFFVYGNKLEKDTNLGKMNTSMMDNYVQNTETTSSQFGKTVNEMANEASNQLSNNITNDTTNTTKYAINTSKVEEKNNSSTTQNNKKESNSEIANTEKKNDDSKKTETKLEDPKFKRPVAGEIIREFAKDKLVYSNTLQEWVTHKGIDIKAEKTTVIKASEEGTIKSIKNDPRYGLTVVIEHNNGFTSVYSNLLTAEFVVEGEKVKQGQTIGTVGNTATFEITDEAHLHFEITKDGEYLDPELYIKD